MNFANANKVIIHSFIYIHAALPLFTWEHVGKYIKQHEKTHLFHFSRGVVLSSMDSKSRGHLALMLEKNNALSLKIVPDHIFDGRMRQRGEYCLHCNLALFSWSSIDFLLAKPMWHVLTVGATQGICGL